MKKEIEDLAFDMDTLRDRLIDLYAIAVNTIEDAAVSHPWLTNALVYPTAQNDK